MVVINFLPLLGLIAGAAAETVHGVVVFTRHGDRTTKHYGAQALTSLGASQCFQVGNGYRARYIAGDSPHRISGISEFDHVPSQIYATAPNQAILVNTATAFLQGLYPPLAGLDPELATQTLNNGTKSTSPLNGYQYVTLQGVVANSPDTIWIKGDDACPAYIEATDSFEQSIEFQARLADTRGFYQSFFPAVESVHDIKSPSDLSYAKAFDIFDLINVARIHNATSPARDVTDAQLFQLRTLADSAEFGYNFNRTQPARSIHAQTLAGAVLAQLNKTVSSAGKLKFSLLAGSYDTMLAFFGLTNLTNADPNFFGLPVYASTMAFELFSPDSSTIFPANPSASLRVRFRFQNGTDSTLDAFPLFGGQEDSLSWPEFVDKMQPRAITTAAMWCNVCDSKADFCAANGDGSATATSSSSGGISNTVAGVIGSMVTLGVVAIVAVLTFVLLRKRAATDMTARSEDKKSFGSHDSRGSNEV
ncbi:histidine phosphatase superfamily [Podospora aff. communis PSN243]|uniref:Histidine phosphatase superfamily n=1 Tax=Podospora aff. communis PSN243 TaxID=3040156 RepID=A0AAV9H278_9PEZI|nr:histidine phosphatase superfamily [Podospora aff. communis PSN243]